MQINKRHSLLCPNCRKLISIDENLCPYCGIKNPGIWWKNNILIKSLSDGEQLIRVLIYTNIAMFIISLLINPGLYSRSLSPFSLLSPDNRSLLILGATGTIPIDRLHRWWTLISASYLHGGVLHILFNMIALSQIAPLVIKEYGVNRMVIIYTVGGVTGYLLSYMAGVSLTIGASAAIVGLIGAIVYYGKSRGGNYGKALYTQVGGWAIGLFMFGLLVPGINNWGHGGGFLGGLFSGILLGYKEKKRETPFHKLLAAGCVLITASVLVWAVISTFLYYTGIL